MDGSSNSSRRAALSLSMFPGSGATNTSMSRVARTSPCAAIAIDPTSTYSTPWRAKAASTRMAWEKSTPEL